MKLLRWLPAVLIPAAIAGLLLPALFPSPVPIGGTPSFAPSSIGPDATASASPLPPTPVPTPAPEHASYVGPSYDTNFVTEPTAHEAQSKLWFHDGSWWGMLISEATIQFHIHELDWDTQRWVDTGVPVDERAFAHSDVLSDGDRLYVASAGTRTSDTHSARVIRFSYDATARRYVLDADFPVRVTSAGVSTMMIEKAQDGELWLAYISGQRVHISRSTSEGLTWSVPAVPAVDKLRVAADTAALVRAGDAMVVVWTTLADDVLYAATHRDGEPDDAWSVESTPVQGLSYGDDHLSVRALSESAGGAIFAAVRTSLDRVPNRNQESPQVVVLRLESDGTWTEYLFGRVRDGHQNPVLMLDEPSARILVFAQASGSIYFKVGSLEEPGFPSGLGTRLIEPGDTAQVVQPSAAPTPGVTPAPSATAEPVIPTVTNVTSTKQGTEQLTELVLLGADDVTGRYAHGAIRLEGGRAPPDSQAHLVPAPPELAGGLPPGAFTYLFRDSFAPYEAGPAVGTGWSTRDIDPAVETLSVVEATAGDPALLLTPTSLGNGPRACKSFGSVTSGVITVEATVQVRGIPDSDATITTLRAPLGEAASVRFGEPGTFRYFDGGARITSGVAFQPGLWYRSILTLDFVSQSYDWQIGVLGSDQPLLAVSDLPLRVEADVVDEVCVQSSNQLPGGGVQMLVDDVSVQLGPGG